MTKLDRMEQAVVDAVSHGMVVTRDVAKAGTMSPMDRGLAALLSIAIKNVPLPDRGPMLGNLMATAIGLGLSPAELHLAIDAAEAMHREVAMLARAMQEPLGGTKKPNGRG